MKKFDYDRIYDFGNLYRGYLASRRSKRGTQEVIQFEMNPELLDSMLSTIMHSAHMLYDNKELIKEETLKKCPYMIQSREQYETDFDNVLQLFSEAKEMMTLYSSYESIVCSQIEFDELSMVHLE